MIVGRLLTVVALATLLYIGLSVVVVDVVMKGCLTQSRLSL